MGLLRCIAGRHRTLGLVVATNIFFLFLLYRGLSSYGSDDDTRDTSEQKLLVQHLPLNLDHRPIEENPFLAGQHNDILPERRREFVGKGEHEREWEHEDNKLYRRDNIHIDVNQVVDMGPCEYLLPPDAHTLSDQVFRRVHKGSKETYVYSAYFDPRHVKKYVLRIIGLSKGDFPIKYCQVWYANDDVAHVYTAEYQIVPETHDRKYAPSVHVCKLEKRHAPYAVSLVNGKCDKPAHALHVHADNPRARPTLNFTVCVTPLNFNFDQYYQLVEMIEVNRMLGANRLVFYNYTSGPAVTKYLDYYASQGVVDVIPWKVPVPVDTWPRQPDVEPEIHYFGQLVALHDCLYRYMFKSKYIVFTDLDEFIIPEKAQTWETMLRRLPCPPATSSYMFLNSFFRTDWLDDPKSAANDVIAQLHLNTLLKLRREQYIWPGYSRSKIMVRPKMIVQLGVHFAYEYVQSSLAVECEVPADLALLHHYRLWEDDGQTAGIDDTRMLNFTYDIIARTSSVHKAVT